MSKLTPILVATSLGAACLGADAPKPRAILLAVTSHDRLGDTGRSTGAYLSEVSHAYYVFTKAGYRVDFVSPKGGRVPLDGLKDQDADNQTFLADSTAQKGMNASLKASTVKPEGYAAIYYAGGHGVMWDFPEDSGLQALARGIYENGGAVGAVCHGPAGLVNLKLSDGSYLIKGHRIATFTNEEEAAVRLTQAVPFPLETRLAERGAVITKAPLFKPHVEQSGRLVTGQNPASAKGVAAALIKTLSIPEQTRSSAMNAITWPEAYLPGTTDNYASNEIIVKGLAATEVWKYLEDTRAWPKYYSNASEIRFRDGKGPQLRYGARFRFTTFGFPVEAEVTEFEAPTEGRPGRMAWHGWVEGDAEHRLDVHHAWLIEDLAGGRVRILTQETQNGKPARDLAVAKPNPMINAHQEWIEGLARAAAQKMTY